MRNHWLVFALGAACFGLAGCANTLARSSWEQLTVESDPAGADVRLSNGVTGTTPVRFGVRRHGDLEVTISKAGYETVVIPVRSRIDTLGAINAVPPLTNTSEPLGLLVAAAELASPAASAHRPNPVKVKLKPNVPLSRTHAIGGHHETHQIHQRNTFRKNHEPFRTSLFSATIPSLVLC